MVRALFGVYKVGDEAGLGNMGGNFLNDAETKFREIKSSRERKHFKKNLSAEKIFKKIYKN